PSEMGPMAMLRSMYSLPSTSHTCAPLPRARYFGATPRTHWPGPFASVWVPPGIRPMERSKIWFERVMLGDVGFCRFDMTMPLAGGRLAPKFGGDLRSDRFAGETFGLEHAGEETGGEPALRERQREDPTREPPSQQDLGDDGVEASREEVIFHGDRELGLA